MSSKEREIVGKEGKSPDVDHLLPYMQSLHNQFIGSATFDLVHDGWLWDRTRPRGIVELQEMGITPPAPWPFSRDVDHSLSQAQLPRAFLLEYVEGTRGLAPLAGDESSSQIAAATLAAAKTSSDFRSTGHTEALIPAPHLLLKSVSHPLFPMQSALWIPIPASVDATIFLTPFHRGAFYTPSALGLIGPNEINAARPCRFNLGSDGASSDLKSFKGAVYYGSVVSYLSNDDPTPQQGVVVLTYIRLTTGAGRDRMIAMCEELYTNPQGEDSINSHVLAALKQMPDHGPVAMMAVWPLESSSPSSTSAPSASSSASSGSSSCFQELAHCGGLKLISSQEVTKIWGKDELGSWSKLVVGHRELPQVPHRSCLEAQPVLMDNPDRPTRLRVALRENLEIHQAQIEFLSKHALQHYNPDGGHFIKQAREAAQAGFPITQLLDARAATNCANHLPQPGRLSMGNLGKRIVTALNASPAPQDALGIKRGVLPRKAALPVREAIRKNLTGDDDDHPQNRRSSTRARSTPAASPSEPVTPTSVQSSKPTASAARRYSSGSNVDPHEHKESAESDEDELMEQQEDEQQEEEQEPGEQEQQPPRRSKLNNGGSKKKSKVQPKEQAHRDSIKAEKHKAAAQIQAQKQAQIRAPELFCKLASPFVPEREAPLAAILWSNWMGDSQQEENTNLSEKELEPILQGWMDYMWKHLETNDQQLYACLIEHVKQGTPASDVASLLATNKTKHSWRSFYASSRKPGKDVELLFAYSEGRLEDLYDNASIFHMYCTGVWHGVESGEDGHDINALPPAAPSAAASASPSKGKKKSRKRNASQDPVERPAQPAKSASKAVKERARLVAKLKAAREQAAEEQEEDDKDCRIMPEPAAPCRSTRNRVESAPPEAPSLPVDEKKPTSRSAKRSKVAIEPVAPVSVTIAVPPTVTDPPLAVAPVAQTESRTVSAPIAVAQSVPAVAPVQQVAVPASIVAVSPAVVTAPLIAAAAAVTVPPLIVAPTPTRTSLAPALSQLAGSGSDVVAAITGVVRELIQDNKEQRQMDREKMQQDFAIRQQELAHRAEETAMMRQAQESSNRVLMQMVSTTHAQRRAARK